MTERPAGSGRLQGSVAGGRGGEAGHEARHTAPWAHNPKALQPEVRGSHPRCHITTWLPRTSSLGGTHLCTPFSSFVVACSCHEREHSREGATDGHGA